MELKRIQFPRLEGNVGNFFLPGNEEWIEEEILVSVNRWKLRLRKKSFLGEMEWWNELQNRTDAVEEDFLYLHLNLPIFQTNSYLNIPNINFSQLPFLIVLSKWKLKFPHFFKYLSSNVHFIIRTIYTPLMGWSTKGNASRETTHHLNRGETNTTNFPEGPLDKWTWLRTSLDYWILDTPQQKNKQKKKRTNINAGQANFYVSQENDSGGHWKDDGA